MTISTYVDSKAVSANVGFKVSGGIIESVKGRQLIQGDYDVNANFEYGELTEFSVIRKTSNEDLKIIFTGMNRSDDVNPNAIIRFRTGESTTTIHEFLNDAQYIKMVEIDYNVLQVTH